MVVTIFLAIFKMSKYLYEFAGTSHLEEYTTKRYRNV
jgi:hypothetical protein